MTITRMRGLVLGVLLASCAALPAAAQAQASAPALSTTTKCLDPHSTVDQFVDVTATGLVPGSSYFPLLDLTSGNDGDVEVGYGLANIDADADGNGTGTVWFDTATYAINTTGDDPDVYLKLRLNADWGLAAELHVPICRPDTTPPVLSLPAATATDATSAAGAPVSFTATANDAVDGAVPVTCDHASGDTFPVGTTTVSCSATDAAGNAASDSFTVVVRPQPTDLKSVLARFGLDARSTAALSEHIDRFVAAGRTKTACNALTALVNEIRARTGTQPGKALTPAQGERLTAAARAFGAALGCR